MFPSSWAETLRISLISAISPPAFCRFSATESDTAEIRSEVFTPACSAAAQAASASSSAPSCITYTTAASFSFQLIFSASVSPAKACTETELISILAAVITDNTLFLFISPPAACEASHDSLKSQKNPKHILKTTSYVPYPACNQFRTFLL